MAIGLSLSRPDLVAVEATEAEAAGFDLIAVGEHLFHHGPAPNPYVQLAAAAAVTERVRLLSSVALLPLYPAPLAAKLAATLDLVSGGRLDLGVGAGGEYPAEFTAAGIDPASRFRRLDEALTVLRLLFSGQRVSLDGEFTVLEEVALDPAPAQPSGPPIWLGGRQAGALRRAGRHADVWMPYMVTPAQVRDGLGEARQAAADAGRDPSSLTGAIFAFVCIDADESWARRTGIAAVSATYRQDFAPLADRYLLLGTPSAVAERLSEYRAAGAPTVVLHVAADDPADRRQVLDSLAAELLPMIGEDR